MNAIKGAILAIISSLFIAILFAYLFRLPVPMVGMVGPWGYFNPYGENVFEVLKSVIIAWLFYGAFGGFIVVSVLGAIAGFFAGHKVANLENQNKMILFWSSVASFIPILVLSTLDFIIGPW